ncbi:helix-turn-helix domain-containing protein [Corynebacterium qintianiae]|uniref:helix-turn-helix domain-containing protein n=1 Tax=Corynebacterium qintianiae TaxID=2709392 RepID=UPI0013ECEAEC|nr:helix-turn-helix domain-containing protein [Corynebacterium qintianiae]
MTIQHDPWLTADQAAAACGAHPQTIRKACRRRDLHASKRGRIWMIRRSDLDTWIEQGAAA